MIRVHPLQLLVCVATMLQSGCGAANPTSLGKSFNVVLAATSDDGEPVLGAQFLTGKISIGTTDKNGRIAVTMRGSDGQSVPISVTCPDGYMAPDEQPSLRLTEVRRVNQSAPATITLAAVCTRKLRDIVLVVRTNNAPSLAVEIGGKSVGATDAEGAAHFHLKLDRETKSVSVSLSTATAPALRPQNPSRVFDLDGRDAILLVDQTFAVDRKTQARRRVAVGSVPPKRIPYRIDSGKLRSF